uniref:Wound-induced protein kinase n=1 Tax=Manihot esculenta TaxID=3983 RepID=Q5XNQ5_MANES|nr:wound-induced protein kinase [Manihot esculenta]
MTPVYKFLTRDDLPVDELSAKKVIRKPSKYALIDGWLYMRSSTQLWLHCIIEDEGQKILKDIHEGDWRSHEETWRSPKKHSNRDTIGQQ